jgi:hypothetical protein
MLCAAAPARGAPSDRIEFTASGNFSETAVRRGVRATRAQCAPLADAVWVDVIAGGDGADEGECLRFWAAGVAQGPRRVVVYFAGDVWTGAGGIEPSYPEQSIERLRATAERWSKRLRAPYIFFARPGTFGSSGDHMQRRRIEESQLISAALDRLKRKLGFEELVLVGQSGGGHVVASLLTQRSDIVCAVPTSSPSSPSISWTM